MNRDLSEWEQQYATLIMEAIAYIHDRDEVARLVEALAALTGYTQSDLYHAIDHVRKNIVRCNHEFPSGARFCILCGIERVFSPATGATTRL